MARTKIAEGGLGTDRFNLPITLNGSDGSSTDAGDTLVLDTSADENDRLLYEGDPPVETMGSLKVTNDVTIDGEIDLEGKLISNSRATFGNGGVSGDTRMLTVVGKDQGTANSAFVVYDSALGVKFNVRNDGYVDIRNDVNCATGSITFGTAGEGVYLGVTSQTAANLLDDYEEGSWTPAQNGVTAAAASGAYTKMGRLVVANMTMTTATSSDTSSFQISGLPFACATIDGSCAKGYDNYMVGSAAHSQAYVPNGTSYIQLTQNSSGASTNAVHTGKLLKISAIYYSAT